jgi:cytochrome bd-type quinol oxidase subunit 2
MTEQPSTRKRSPVQGGELISGLSALLLLGLMFGVEWFGVAGVPGASQTGAATTSAVDAWHAMTILRWLMLVTILVTLGAVVLHATQRSHGRTTETGFVITGLGSVTAALLVWRVLIQLPKPDQIIDQKFGAVVGLVAALGIAFGGFERWREEQRVARRLEQRSSQNPEVANRTGAR